MIKSFWIAGILFTLSSFGIKAGLGAAAVSYNETIPGRKKFFLLSGMVLVYSCLFFGLYAVTAHFQLLRHLDRFLEVLRYGMAIHLLVALGLIILGVRLLLFGTHRSAGAFLLIFPCPVCATVIFLSLSFAYKVFLFSPLSITALLLGVFLSVSLVTMFIVFPFRRHIGTKDASFLGLVMIFAAVYFFLTVIIALVYQETQNIYRLASRVSATAKGLDLKFLLALSVIGIVLFSIGFLRERKKLNLERSK